MGGPLAHQLGLWPIPRLFGPSLGPSAHLLGLWPISLAFNLIILQSMYDLDTLQGRYPENFVLISQLEVCQEGGVKKGGTWRTLRVPDQRNGGQGHP